MTYAYFPGCSLKGMGKAYEESFLAVCEVLGIGMRELDDWNCCGATAYMSVDENAALMLAARNLALAGQAGADVVAPCAACYLGLNKAVRYLDKYPQHGEPIRQALESEGMGLNRELRVRHPLDVIVNDFGLPELAARVKRPLGGLKVACYYGCQIVRPFADFDDQFRPRTMDDLAEVLGAEVVEYPLRAKCCGGSLTGTLPEVGQRLAYNLLREARRRGAELIVTACPLCQFNLEGYQDKIAAKYRDVSLPTVYFTQLVGLALGLAPRELGLQRHIVSVDDVLRQRQVVPA